MNEWIICPQGVPDPKSNIDASVLQEKNGKDHAVLVEASNDDEKYCELGDTPSRGGWNH